MPNRAGTGLQIGETFAGYSIEAILGRGGMGTVYLATHKRLQRKAALKVLIPELADDEDFRARFIRESQTAAALDHPSVVPVYDADEEEDVLFIAMKFVEGSDLKTVLKAEKTLTPERTAEIVGQIGGALDAAHGAGLVHRDVKPANILIEERSGSAYLTDFGVAKSSTATGMTRTGSFLGTVDYCAPEQISAKPIDGRVDIYALGCVLFHCLAGQPPYVRETEVAVIHAHLTDPAPALSTVRPGLPRELDGVIVTAMAKHPEVRYGTGAALAEAFHLAVGGKAPVPETVLEPPASSPTVADTKPPIVVTPGLSARADQQTRVVRWRWTRNRKIAAAAIGALLLVGSIVGVMIGTSGDPSHSADNGSSPSSDGDATPDDLSSSGGRGNVQSSSGGSNSVSGSPSMNRRIANILVPLEGPQTAVAADLTSLSRESPSSFGALSTSSATLKDRVLVAEGSSAGLSSSGPAERQAITALNAYLRAMESYVRAVSAIGEAGIVDPGKAERAQSKAAVARGAYASLRNATGSPCCPQLSFSGTQHLSAVARRPAVRAQTVGLTQLLEGFGPDDPAGDGRCFGPYTSRAVVTVNGIDYRSNFIQCGDYGGGDPWRANGTYRFASGPSEPGAALRRFVGLAVVDANSSSGRIGSTVSWTVLVDGTPVCHTSIQWYGDSTPGRQLDCPIRIAGPADTSRISIVQDANLEGAGAFWAGLLNPRVTIGAG